MGVCARVVRHGDYASHRSATEHTQLVSFCDDGSRLRDGSDYLAKEELFWRMNDIVLGIWGQDFRFDVLTRVQSAQSSNNTIVANHVWSLDSNASTHGYTGTVSNCVTPSTDNATNYLSKKQSLSPCLANTTTSLTQQTALSALNISCVSDGRQRRPRRLVSHYHNGCRRAMAWTDLLRHWTRPLCPTSSLWTGWPAQWIVSCSGALTNCFREDTQYRSIIKSTSNNTIWWSEYMYFWDFQSCLDLHFTYQSQLELNCNIFGIKLLFKKMTIIIIVDVVLHYENNIKLTPVSLRLTCLSDSLLYCCIFVFYTKIEKWKNAFGLRFPSSDSHDGSWIFIELPSPRESIYKKIYNRDKRRTSKD